MKFAMIGTGGIGGFYAAKLMSARHEVTLLARGAHLQALQTCGLRVQHGEQSYHFESVDCDDTESFFASRDSRQFDLIILAVKAQASAGFADELGRWYEHCGHNVPVISFQNGVDNEQLLAARLGDGLVLGALLIGVGAHITSPGQIESTGPGRVVMGVWPNEQSTPSGPAISLLSKLVPAFNAAGFPAERTSDIRQELWRKLIINNGVNPLSALTDLDTRSLTTGEPFEPIALGLMEEVVAAARADGVELGEDAARGMLTFMQEFDAIKTSMLVDKEKGRPLETDAISGAVLARAAQLGIDVPYTRCIHALLSLQETRRHSPPQD